MRGHADSQLPLFHTFHVEDRIRRDHPLRDIKLRVDKIFKLLRAEFDRAYSHTGRPSVPPERLLKAMLLQGLYSIRSERQLCEQIDVNLLYRWFLDMSPSDDAFDSTTFTKNRERLEGFDLIPLFFHAVVKEALTKNLCSDHFSVDGTLIESFASAKSFRPKDEVNDDSSNHSSDSNSFKPSNPDVDFHGQKRTNETHVSRTDPEARLYRKSKGQEAKLSHMGHALTENRNGLVMAISVSEANGTAEREEAAQMLLKHFYKHGHKPKTVGADKGYDSGIFFRAIEALGIEPHVPLRNTAIADISEVSNDDRCANILARRRMEKRMGTLAFRLSQKARRKVEESFGWLKMVAGLDRCRTVGRGILRQTMAIGASAYNLVRLRSLAPMVEKAT
jgi:transposase